MKSSFGDPVDVQAIVARHQAHFRRPAAQIALTSGAIALGLGLFIFGLFRLGISPERIITGVRQIGWFITLMMPPSPGPYLLVYVEALAETLAIAFLGTTVAAVLAFPFAFLAARNVIPNWLFRFVTRRFLDTVRSVDTLIWALIWISVVGLGPFAGVLAIATSDFGAFGKLFSEAVETADKRPIEGITSTGATPWMELRFGILPQVIPVLAAQVLYYFESNTRSATIIGIVGAGGIGLQLSEQIRTLEWPHVAFIILMILAVVAVIDWISSKLRFAVIGKRAL